MKTYTELPDDAGSNIIGQVNAQATRISERLSSVDQTIAIMSGKGGVGKSAITTNLATALTLNGCSVGIVDADINGPSIAKMMGVRKETLEYTSTGVIPAKDSLGTKIISMDLLLSGDDAPVMWSAHSQKDAFTWRNTMEVGALREFIGDTEWGELDFLLLDLPPGSDRLPNVVELIPNLSGVVVVTIPSEVSHLIVNKSVTLARETLNVPIIGFIENMSFYVCKHCGEEEPLYPTNETHRTNFDLTNLGNIPFDPRLSLCSDSGTPIVNKHPDSPTSKSIMNVAQQIQQYFSI